ncbi:LTA synthase family protein [Hungatella hathewayi]|uniref:LTA synthase family protein n=1 Tax=Hungatella hathewayi TaxID=154046 RepID=UPI00356B4418
MAKNLFKNIVFYFKQSYYLIGVIINSFFIWLQLDCGLGYESILQPFSMKIQFILLNVITVLFIILILGMIINKMGVSCLIISILGFIISVVNYYTIKFHGLPLSVLDIYNIKTALNVAGTYKFMPDIFTNTICLLFFINIINCIMIIRCEKKTIFSFKHLVKRNISFIVIILICIYFGYISPNSLKPYHTVTWSWKEAYQEYGYLTCTLELAVQMKEIVKKPEGYSQDKIENIEIEVSSLSSIKPDIILILNETFYDLNQITAIETDTPYMKNINEMDNLKKGYAVVPVPGGGTNNSEYELLTSNSLQIMQGITPFNILNMKGANSIVSVLKQLGYQTLGAHSEPASNYSRGRAYPDMGFDKVYFNDELFKRYYGNRYYATDESLYENLINWYKQMDDNTPKFLYLLTVQNHGDWDMNAPELDTVHLKNDFGDYTEKINEYLSCISQSDIAFKELTDYFLTVERPVIICMVGDHAPSFALDIVDPNLSEIETNERLRKTPLLIWSNYDIDDIEANTISLNFVIPNLFKMANIKMSPYYSFISDLSKNVPIVSSYGIYKDLFGNTYSYGDNTNFTNEINQYFYMEYNNLQNNRRQELFDIETD